MTKKAIRIFLIILLTLLGLSVAFLVAVRYPAFQTFLARRATDILSKTLDTKVSIERVEISFFNKADLVNFYLEDHHHDTLIYAKELKVEFKVFELFKKQVKVSKVLLDEGTFHLYRDSTGTVTNISELFKSFQTAKTDSVQVKNKQAFTWDIDLKEAELRKTDFRYKDDKSHMDLRVGVPSADITISNFDLKKNQINIQAIELDGADVLVNLAKRPPAADNDSASEFHFLKDGPTVTFNKLSLTHARFRLNDNNSDTVLAKGMDFKHLDVAGIHLLAVNGSVIGDTIATQVKTLAAKERSGFELLNLSTQARVSVNDITLDKLDLKTPNSEIKKFLSFRYSAFHDFKDFVNQVRIKATFDGTRLSLKDLNYFIRKADKVEHNQFLVDGEIDGRINNLKGRGLEIRTGKNTFFKGDFYTHGLPNIYETSLNLRVNRLATTAADIRAIVPNVQLPKNLDNLGLIYYVGAFDGFVTDFVSKGKLVTSIGSATTDINFKYDKDKNKAAYTGDLALNEFDLGKYFDNEVLLGKLSLNTKIKGGGITLESLHAQLDGTVTSVTLKGYEYRDIKVNGSILKKSFNGVVNIRDQYLDADFNGKADISKAVPEFNFDAVVRKAWLKNLNLLKDDIKVAASMNSNFKGSKIDDALGAISLKDIQVSRDTINATVKYLTLNARFLAGEKKAITLTSDMADGEMKGNFTLKALPAALLDFGRYTFVKNYTDTTAKVPQDFTLDLVVYETHNLPQIFVPKLHISDRTHITGDFNSSTHKLNITANVPEIALGDIKIKRTNLNATSENRVFNFETSVDRVYNGDSIMLDSVSFLAKTVGDGIRFDLTGQDKNKYNYANLTAFFTPLENYGLLHLEPCDVKLGNNYWHFDPNNSIYFDGKKITTNNLVFRTSDQAVYINSYVKDDTATSVKFTLANTNLIDFARTFTTKVKDLSGNINGSLTVDNVFNKPEVYADLVVNDFTLGKELIGDIDIVSTLDSTSSKLLLKASVKSINNNLDAGGYISIDPKNPGMLLDVKASRLGLNFLNYPFFDKYVKNCRGYATINAQVYGTLKKPLLRGDVGLINDTVTVSFLNTTYRLDNQHVKLDEHGFNIGTLTIYDINNNMLTGSGRINHESFKNFALDLKVSTENAQFLNTTVKQSPNFYGVAYGKGNVTFIGPINSPVITAYAQTKQGTYCHLPINSSYETNRYSFYKFVGHGKDTVNNNIKPQLKLNGVTFSIKVDVTPDARMDIILDPVTGDVLTGYGNGSLRIEIPRNGNINMRGQYTLEQGNYLFTLQNIVNKRFELANGGTITFDGEVYKAKLNVDAVYEVRSSVSDLIDDLITSGNTTSSGSNGSQNQLTTAALSRIPIRLLMHLTGVLERPNIGFDIKAVDPDPIIKSYVEQKLTLLKNNETEMNKQVFGLLVMNRFISTNTFTTSSSYSGTAANTVSEFISSQLSNYLSNLLEFANIRNLDVNFGYRQYDQSYLTNGNGSATPQSTLDTRRELQLALSQRLLNNRLSISAGGNIDFGNTLTDPVSGLPVANSKAVIPTGDFQVEYSLTPNGTWRAKVFNRTNYDYVQERNSNKTGVGISYRQEFDKPSDLIRKKSATGKKKKSAGGK